MFSLSKMFKDAGMGLPLNEKTKPGYNASPQIAGGPKENSKAVGTVKNLFGYGESVEGGSTGKCSCEMK